MTVFAIIATLLIVVVSAFVLPPLWLGLRAPARQADRKEINLSIFRDQLAELECEKAEGELNETDFEQTRRELQRRLLEEVEPADASGAVPAGYGPSRKTAIAILMLLPLLALVGYSILGDPKALDPTATRAVEQAQVTPEQINAMVAQLAAKMEANPDDMQGWLMLARSYKALGRFEEAVQAYGKAEKVVNETPDLLASYAEAVAMAGGRGLLGKPQELVEKALKIDPNHGHSLFLAGAAAMEAGDNKKGIAYWEKLLPQVEPGSEIEQMLKSGIDKMKQGKQG